MTSENELVDMLRLFTYKSTGLFDSFSSDYYATHYQTPILVRRLRPLH
jgi:hypothetical protein